ncbi:S9 family peptidase [uncultured Shewanella sp.]|uniref:alpha/beta hydrolase family protein n=1 Tax=uncultured Shewanella sp. TaxID=173975 RepID=UPI00260A36C2|nr:S9 family peptidase [uncultured Shewanella sp.]
MKLIKRMIASVSVAMLSCSALAISVEDLSKHREFYNVKISPDGKHLAVLVNDEGRKTLAFLETDSFEVTYTLNGGERDQAGDYFWVNDERVIVQLEQVRGALELPLSYGEIFGVNYDGRKRKMIFGYRSKGGVVLAGYAGFLLDNLDGDNKHILIRKQLMDRRSDIRPSVVRLNVYNGREKRIKKAPIAYSQFLVDNDGNPRFVAGIDKNYNAKLFYSKGKNQDWQPFGEEFEGEFSPIRFTQDNQGVYALKSVDGKPKGLFKYDLATGKETLLYQSDIADPTYPISSSLNGVYGLRMDEDYPTYLFIEPDLEEAKLHKALAGAFNGDSVAITSMTRDGRLAVVHVSGDKNPGEFYLFDTENMSAKFLLSSAKWVDKTQLAATEPFRIKTPDGLVLNGLLTLPVGKSENLPTVVLPHGGPHARDYWGYNSQVQLLASAGYAVVQVNFRGSAGYGKNFEEAGYGHWGTKIQDDILLATQYAIQQGIADKDRVCIFGASFGGYSALQSAIRKPDAFKCAIGYVGVYDLEMLYSEGDIKELTWGGAYLDETLGKGTADLIAQSPVHNLDKLKAPVLIIHGEDDQRAHFEHALALKEAMDKKGHPYEWLVKDKEGHGFYKEENIIEANKTILNFLDKHIGD